MRIKVKKSDVLFGEDKRRLKVKMEGTEDEVDKMKNLIVDTISELLASQPWPLKSKNRIYISG